MTLTVEERRSKVWRKVLDYVEKTTQLNRERNDGHLDHDETTKIRARNEALRWLVEALSPSVVEVNEPEPDFPFDE